MFCIYDCFFYVWFVSLIYKSDVFSLYWHKFGIIMVNKSLHVFNFFPLHVLSVFLFLLRDLHFTYFVLYFMWVFFYFVLFSLLIDNCIYKGSMVRWHVKIGVCSFSPWKYVHWGKEYLHWISYVLFFKGKSVC